MGLSRSEDILRSVISGSEYNEQPQSRIEALLLELGEKIETGGATPEEVTSAVQGYLAEHPELVTSVDETTPTTKLQEVFA